MQPSLLFLTHSQHSARLSYNFELILILSLGQTSLSTCLPCSPSQSCPEGTSTPTASGPTPVQSSNTWQLVIQVMSGIGSFIGILVAVFRVYPAIKARVDKLREAGIKPTLKRVVFLQKTLSKYRPLLEPSERIGSLQAVAPDTTPDPRTARGVAEANTFSALATAHALPMLPSLTALQVGHLVRRVAQSSEAIFFHRCARDALLQVAGIGPAYTDYRQFIIDNRLTGQFIASNSEGALKSVLKDMGITKELHVFHIVTVLMQLKSGDEGALAAAFPDCL
jgi:hypothetical protein